MAEALPVVKGTLDVLVLKALSWNPMHGFEVTRWLEERSGKSLGIEDSALYQALYRLEGRGLLETEWGVTEHKRRARYYRMSAAGFLADIDRMNLEIRDYLWSLPTEQPTSAA